MADRAFTSDGPDEDRLFGPLSDAEVAALLSETPTRALAAGERLPAHLESSCDGEFRLFERIGAGGQGEVWLARQEELQRIVAVKVLLGSEEEAFRKEAMVAAALDHPNIIPVHRMCRVPRFGSLQPALVMKLARGMPWSRLIRQEHPGNGQAPSSAYLARHLRLFIAMCNALAYAHDRGIVHRDLKPSQVIVGEYGEVYLTDWGMAIVLLEELGTTRPLDGRANEGMPTRESSSATCGTPAYMAPEQAEDSNERIGRHTDIYQLGGVLFEILAGHPPREVRGLGSALLAIHENQRRSVPDHAPRELRTLVDHCLATRPEDRPEAVAMVRKAVEEYLDGIGRQADSRQLSDDVARKLGKVEGDALDYKEAGALIEQVNAARELWPGNSDAELLRRKLLAHQVEHALRQGDLGFARGTCVGLPADSEERKALEHRIEDADRLQKRHHRQRKLAVTLSVLLLVLLVAGALGFARHQRDSRLAIERKSVELAEQRDLAEARRQEALEARNNTEATLQEVLYELDLPLRSVDRLESLRSIAELGLEYYRGKEVSTLRPEDLRMQAWAYLRLSDVFVATLALTDARSAVKNALELQVKAFRETQKETYLADLIIGKESLVAIEALRGNVAEWEHNLVEAHRYASALAKQSPKSYHISRHLWLSCLAAKLAFQKGEDQRGRVFYEEAETAFEKLLEIAPEDQSMAQNMENAGSLLGLIAVKYLGREDGLDRVREAIRSNTGRRDPLLQDPYQRQDLVLLRRREAEALLALERWDDALMAAERAMEEQLLLVAARPDNRNRSLSLGEVAALAAEAALRVEDPERAVEHAAAAIRCAEPLCELASPPYRAWELQAIAHWVQGEVLTQAGNTSEAAMEFEAAMGYWEQMPESSRSLDGPRTVGDRIRQRMKP